MNKVNQEIRHLTRKTTVIGPQGASFSISTGDEILTVCLKKKYRASFSEIINSLLNEDVIRYYGTPVYSYNNLPDYRRCTFFWMG